MTASRALIGACLKKMRVLRGQEYFVSDEVLLEILARRILTAAEDLDHVERMLAAWISKTKAMLHVTDIGGLASETARRILKAPRTDCKDCYGNGWVIIEQDGGTAAKRCACWSVARATGTPTRPAAVDTGTDSN
jgi:hypothetical protein